MRERRFASFDEEYRVNFIGVNDLKVYNYIFNIAMEITLMYGVDEGVWNDIYISYVKLHLLVNY